MTGATYCLPGSCSGEGNISIILIATTWPCADPEPGPTPLYSARRVDSASVCSSSQMPFPPSPFSPRLSGSVLGRHLLSPSPIVLFLMLGGARKCVKRRNRLSQAELEFLCGVMGGGKLWPCPSQSVGQKLAFSQYRPTVVLVRRTAIFV